MGICKGQRAESWVSGQEGGQGQGYKTQPHVCTWAQQATSRPLAATPADLRPTATPWLSLSCPVQAPRASSDPGNPQGHV